MEQLESQLQDILNICDSIQSSEVNPETLQLFRQAELELGMASASHSDVGSATRIKADADRWLAAVEIVEKEPMLEEAIRSLQRAEESHSTIIRDVTTGAEITRLAKEITDRAGTLDESAIMLDKDVSAYIQALREAGNCPTCLGIVDEDIVINLKEKL